MPIATLKEVEKKLGLSPKDTVEYEKTEREIIIRVEFDVKKRGYKNRKSAKEIFEDIVAMGENLNTKDWAKDYKESKIIKD
jgi:bifunctional DNA-binding transcriptional regulator/antitoxin component of YhaV-PrlF toxin-antitoxin module